MAEAEIERQIDNLKRQRRSLKTSLTRSLTKCQGPNITASEIVVRAEQAEEYFKQFESIQQRIEELTPDEHLQAEERYREEIEDRYYAIKSLRTGASQGQDQSTLVSHSNHNDEGLRAAVQAVVDGQNTMATLINSMATSRLDASSDTPTISQQPETRHQMRLPTIQIPEFDGSVLEWLRFRDLFESMIDARSNISNAEKLEYLQTKLKGDALSVIKHLRPTNDNYIIARDLLRDKYDNSEKIRQVYLTLLLEQQPVRSESVTELRRFYNGVNESYNALKVLEEPVDSWNSILIFMLEKKLDAKSVSLWYREKNKNEAATFSQFMSFVDKRLYELESTQPAGRSGRVEPAARSARNEPAGRNPTRALTATTASCPGCNQNHQLYQCTTFKAMSMEERKKLVRSKKLCFNCLQSGHWLNACTSSSCRQCGEKHNTLLHVTNPPQGQRQEGSTDPEVTVGVGLSQRPRTYVLLPTALITVVASNGEFQVCRALLDSGSQTTLISEACAQRLQLKRKQDRTVLFGINANTGCQTRGKVKLVIRSTINDNTVEAEALCLTNLTQTLPSQQLEDNKLKFFSHLTLADKSYDRPAKIDVILGADVFMECCLPERLTHPSGAPTALNTIFGWVLLGNVSSTNFATVMSCCVGENLDRQLQRFWEIEEVPSLSPQLSEEEQAAEEHFVHNTSQDDAGRYVVKLPFKNDKPNLGHSKSMALKRLMAMERRFVLQPELQSEYIKFMDQYIQLGHMERTNDKDSGNDYYLPHHAVVKESSTSTKLRVVFDASCKSSNNTSLNDTMLVGAKQQNDIFDIIIMFRKFEVGFIGDVEKMYRQIWVHPLDRKWQKILWRLNPNEDVQEFQLKTITYGTASAPFLATRTLREIANRAQVLFPSASDAIQQQFYVDDWMGCAPTIGQAIQLKDEVSDLLSKSGLQLRKWASNSPKLLETIKPEDRESSAESEIDQSQTVGTLGLLWNTERDSFRYKVSLSPMVHPVTKRTVLSDISKIYDPLGWLSPMVVKLKIFMQQLWLKGVGWDEPVSARLLDQWVEGRSSINAIHDLHIPRWVGYDHTATVQLHGFSDASELAYAATVYTRVIHTDGQVLVRLVAAKSRVAPVKQVTLPRLELCAAVLLTKLMVRVQRALRIPQAEMFGWSDSTVVLFWLADHPRRWKSFIANRTAQIISVIPASRWQHVRSQNNPADLATRGIISEPLMTNSLWWHGPNMLQACDIPNSERPMIPEGIDMEERREQGVYGVAEQPKQIIEQYSNFSQLVRIVAWLYRFITNCKTKRTGASRITGFLSVDELNRATQAIVKKTQHDTFKQEIRWLASGQQLPTTHRLIALSPFVDENGLLRVGGRLENAQVKYDQKHPVILDKNHYVTEILIRCYHLRYLHAGKRLLHCLLKLKYWIVDASIAIKRCVYKCPVCMRHMAQPYKQKMGDLPSCRVEAGMVFNNVGVDFAGPIQIRSWKGRGPKIYKCWMAIFVCLVSKALHVEPVTELSTEAFLAALRRFCARRGRPCHLYCDNGTNFVGAKNYLNELYELLRACKTQETITTALTNDGITWHFSPPAGPHFGGMWEAGVKSVKFHLKRIMNDSTLTYEELTTVLCQVEGCLNSRPLCLKTDNELDPLTPAHFLIMRPMMAVIDEDLAKVRENRLTRWKYVQRLVQQFWQRWSVEYLHQLQQRAKWVAKQPNVSTGEVVLIKDDNLPPSKWYLGRILKTHPGKDGLVRVVTVKTAKGEMTRPLIKLCPLTKEC